MIPFLGRPMETLPTLLFLPSYFFEPIMGLVGKESKKGKKSILYAKRQDVAKNQHTGRWIGWQVWKHCLLYQHCQVRFLAQRVGVVGKLYKEGNESFVRE